MNYLLENLYFFTSLYFLLINIFNFVLFGIDKKRARFKRWRVSEKTFLFLSLIGGSIGALIGMNFFRHKTKKPLFRILLPIFLILNFICLILMLNYLEGLEITSSPGLQLF